MKGKVATSVGIIVFIYAVLAMLTTSCDNSNKGPTAPDMVPAPIGSMPTPNVPASTPNPEPEPELPPTGFNGHISLPSGGTIRAWAENLDDETRKVIFVCYEDPTGNIEDQKLIRPLIEKRIDAGDRAGFKIDKPKCKYQCDLVTRVDGPIVPPFYNEYQLIAFQEGGKGVCKEPPCIGCTPTPCTPDPEPQCENGTAIYNPGDCTWTCPPPPECETCENSSESLACIVDTLSAPQVLNGTMPVPPYVVKCEAYASHAGLISSTLPGLGKSFTGSTTAVSLPIPCGPQSADHVVSLFNKDYTCSDGSKIDPPGVMCGTENVTVTIPKCPEPPICKEKPPPDCPEQQWIDFPDCKWVGECVCEPVGEPECPEQTWDEELCAWVGKCPEFKCPEYTLPVTWCHVSSKKQGGINEDTMTHEVQIPPGHCMHFDPNKWCPPDYLGPCDGRSFSYQCPQ